MGASSVRFSSRAAIAEPLFRQIFIDPFLVLQRDHHCQVEQLRKRIGVGDDVENGTDLHQFHLMGEAALPRRRAVLFDLVAGADDIGHVAIGAAVFVRHRGAAGRNQKCKANEDDAK